MDRECKATLSSFLSVEPCVNVRRSVPLSTLTSIGIGGNAACVLMPRDGGCMIRLLDRLVRGNAPFRVIGNGTNLVAPDAGYDGILVQTAGIDRISVSGNVLIAGAGAPLGRVIRRAMESGLSGLEELYGIPGTVGGALYMNAGAYGKSVSDRLRYATVYCPGSGEVTVRTPASLSFGYRTGAIMKDGLIVLSAAFTLTPAEPSRIAEKMGAILDQRKTTQPLTQPSAGSVFRRPSPDRPVGKLIADAGCAGLTEGGAAVSDLHAGFIVNTGGASEADVRRLIERVKEKVSDAFGVELVPEIEFLSELGAYGV